MVKRVQRQAFAAPSTSRAPEQRPEKLIDTTRGMFAFFRDHGVRETIESIIVAVVLALMFRAYEAEAFIIPTGSMAPSLQGQHLDVVCDECGYQYRTGDSKSSGNGPRKIQPEITKTFCPICRFGLAMKQSNPDHSSNDGDRILVNKFVYDFQPPERFDVIVFKNPNNGKQNYIKRLVGLPGDHLLIENGDIHNLSAGDGTREIVRKPADKIDAMLQLVDDTQHVSKRMRSVGWPSRWREWADPNAHWKENESEGHPFYLIDSRSEDLRWLRYRHLTPRSPFDEFCFKQQRRENITGGAAWQTEWDQIENGRLPDRIQSDSGGFSAGSLIRDYYEYNDRRYRLPGQGEGDFNGMSYSNGAHWVGDLAVDCEVRVESATGTLGLDLVEGGVHFRCLIDIETGTASLATESDDGQIVFDTADSAPPKAETNLRGPGAYRIRYAQIDNMVHLWVNDRYADFGGSSYRFKQHGRPVPRYSPDDPGDAEPIGIGARSASIRVDRLKVLRDIYYVAPAPVEDLGNVDITNETGTAEALLIKVYEQPGIWNSETALKIFRRPLEQGPIFKLAEGQYFPMGDNSPASQDARIWGDDHFVDEDYLIGRAMYIYWPHSLNRPIRFFPNFKRMGFIR